LSCIEGKERKLGTKTSQSVEKPHWKRLSACPKTDYRTMVIDDFMSLATIVNSVFISSCKVPDIFSPILSKFGLSQKIFKKVFTMKLHENLFRGSQAYTFGQTDRRSNRRRDR
jgi:hypothetical protein